MHSYRHDSRFAPLPRCRPCEVLFYLELRDQVSTDELYCPRLESLIERPDGSISMMLERVENAGVVFDRAQRLALCGSFGRMGGRSHGCDALAHADWLPRGRGIGTLAQLPARAPTVEAMAHVGLEDEWPGVEATLANRDMLCALYAQGHPVLCHGDANHHNIRGGEQPGRFVAVDWPRVQLGMAGDDLARLVYPHVLTHGHASSAEELTGFEEAALAAYLAGLQERVPEADPQRVRVSFYIKSLVLCLALPPVLMHWVSTDSPAQSRDAREGGLMVFYRHMADRASFLSALGSEL